ncbi:MAG: hypothetical protein Kow0032_11240 [Methyloligellaceae bacterium]
MNTGTSGGGAPSPVADREREARYQKWVSRAYAFAGLCLAALAVVEATDTATPLVRTLLMLGIGAAGTAAWVMQAKRVCPKCGTLYGYHFRIVNANVCRRCGAEFPRWRPGEKDQPPEAD